MGLSSVRHFVSNLERPTQLVAASEANRVSVSDHAEPERSSDRLPVERNLRPALYECRSEVLKDRRTVGAL